MPQRVHLEKHLCTPDVAFDRERQNPHPLQTPQSVRHPQKISLHQHNVRVGHPLTRPPKC